MRKNCLILFAIIGIVQYTHCAYIGFQPFIGTVSKSASASYPIFKTNTEKLNKLLNEVENANGTINVRLEQAKLGELISTAQKPIAALHNSFLILVNTMASRVGQPADSTHNTEIADSFVIPYVKVLREAAVPVEHISEILKKLETLVDAQSKDYISPTNVETLPKKQSQQFIDIANELEAEFINSSLIVQKAVDLIRSYEKQTTDSNLQFLLSIWYGALDFTAQFSKKLANEVKTFSNGLIPTPLNDDDVALNLDKAYGAFNKLMNKLLQYYNLYLDGVNTFSELSAFL